MPSTPVSTRVSRFVWSLRLVLAACLCIIQLPLASAATPKDEDAAKLYKIHYQATLDPSSGEAQVSITLQQKRQLLRSIEFVMPAARYRNVRSESGSIETRGDRVTWQPDKKGGQILFDFIIDHKRKNGAADARITQKWALLKLDHLFPRATARTVKGAEAVATLTLSAPKGWGIETPYGIGADETFNVSDPQRRFDKPLGWMMAGDLAVRRDRLGERKISVASPMGSGLHANDILAFVRWTLPSLVALFPDFPERLLIVSGSDDMWRGGLSGVGSLYLHRDRPMISGNRTSALLHELFHVASRMHGKNGADWIVEGLAEYYSLTLLLRSGAISEFRYHHAFEELADWSKGTECAATDRSSGKQTARAALVMLALDEEIRTATQYRSSLDTLVQKLLANKRTISNDDFRSVADALIGGPSTALANCP